MRTGTIVAASAGIILAGLATADVVGNIEFGTDFIAAPPGSSGEFLFSSSNINLTRTDDQAAGSFTNTFGLAAGNTWLSGSIAAVGFFNEIQATADGELVNGLSSNAGNPDASFVGIFGGQGEGFFQRDRNFDMAPGTPFYAAFELADTRLGFVQFEYVETNPGNEFEPALYDILQIGWAVQVEASDDDLHTFDVRNGIPAPTTAGLLGLAGIAATRRRR